MYLIPITNYSQGNISSHYHRKVNTVKFLVHRRVEYQAFPKRHSTAINRNGKHAEGKAITAVQDMPFEVCLKQGTTSTSDDVVRTYW
jgi:hypothetical protein